MILGTVSREKTGLVPSNLSCPIVPIHGRALPRMLIPAESATWLFPSQFFSRLNPFRGPIWLMSIGWNPSLSAGDSGFRR
jgi:hypothetical protein